MTRLIGLFVGVLASLLVTPAAVHGQLIGFNKPADTSFQLLCSAANLSLATTGTIEETLATCTIPANTFPAANGLMIETHWDGAANVNNKNFRTEIGSTNLHDRASTTSSEQFSAWAMCAVSATDTLRCHASQSLTTGTTAGNFYTIRITSGVDFTAALSVNFNAETPTASGDAILRAYSVWITGPTTGEITLGGSLTGTDLLGTSSVCAVGAQDTANSVCLLADRIEFEGATADAFGFAILSGDHTADGDWTFTVQENGATDRILTTTSQSWVHQGAEYRYELDSDIEKSFGIVDAGFRVGGDNPPSNFMRVYTTANTALDPSVAYVADAPGTTGSSIFMARNDLGSAAQGFIVQRGSAVTTTYDTLDEDNLFMVQSGGASSAGMLIGTETDDPLYLGTNDTIHVELETGGALNVQSGIFQLGALDIRQHKQVVTSAEVLALNTTPITLLAGESGISFVPLYWYARKPAGTAYVVGGSNDLQLMTGAFQAAVMTGSQGFFESTANEAQLTMAPSAPTLVVTFGISATAGNAITIEMSGSDPTTGDSDLHVFVWYLRVSETLDAS